MPALRKTQASTVPTPTVTTVIYVTRDIERALGMEPGENYRIIANDGIYAREIKKKYPEYVSLLETGGPLDTYGLLVHAETERIIADISKTAVASLLVFKNTSRIEALCTEKKWKLSNPPSMLAEKIENKISQIAWLGEVARYLPVHEIVRISDIKHVKVKKPFVIQWAHGHTGGGTVFVPSGPAGDTITSSLLETFPDREARVSEYIKGPMFTLTICVGGKGGGSGQTTGGRILAGNISYQITGMLPFTDNPFATVGNDWSLPHTILSEAHIAEFTDIARAVGKRMLESGWSGLFGIDCIYDEERDNLRLIEVNARQPASTTYESELQEKTRKAMGGNAFPSAATGMTLFEAHIAALTGKLEGKSSDSAIKLTLEINDGAQVIKRVAAKPRLRGHVIDTIDGTASIVSSNVKKLRQKNYTVIEYENGKPGADLLRIQSSRGIMETHNKFNSRGKEILAIVSGTDVTDAKSPEDRKRML